MGPALQALEDVRAVGGYAFRLLVARKRLAALFFTVVDCTQGGVRSAFRLLVHWLAAMDLLFAVSDCVGDGAAGESVVLETTRWARAATTQSFSVACRQMSTATCM